MAYTDKELVDATQVAYVDFTAAYEKMKRSNPGKESFSIEALTIIAKEIDPNVDLSGLERLTSEQKRNWKISGIRDTNSTTGFYACIIETSTGDAIVGFRGSEEPTDLKQLVLDWGVSDFGLLNANETVQQIQAGLFLNQYKNKLAGYNNLSLTGHSLGGNLAEYTMIISPLFGLDKHITRCVSFDGPGFSNEFLIANALNIFKVKDKMKHYRWSTIGNLLLDIPGVEYNTCRVSNKEGKEKMKNFTRHNTMYLDYDENGMLVPGEKDLCASAITPLIKIIECSNISRIWQPTIRNLYFCYCFYELSKKVNEKLKDKYSDISNSIKKLFTDSDYIKVDMTKLGDDAAYTVTLLENLKKNIDEMYENINSLNGMWSGTAHQAYLQKFANEYESIKSYLEVLSQYAHNLIKDENAYRLHERKAIEVMNSLRI